MILCLNVDLISLSASISSTTHRKLDVIENNRSVAFLKHAEKIRTFNRFFFLLSFDGSVVVVEVCRVQRYSLDYRISPVALCYIYIYMYNKIVKCS